MNTNQKMMSVSGQNYALIKAGALFDSLHAMWDEPKLKRSLYLVLAAGFVICGLAALFNRLGWLPEPLVTFIPDNPFFAVQLAFTLILLLEVIDLVFSLPASVALAAAKQMEIMALLLLRESFSDIGLLSAHGGMEDWFNLMQIGATALGGLIMFTVRGLFLKIYFVQEYDDMAGYINTKKCICLFLFLMFLAAAIYDLHAVVLNGQKSQFFSIFYTALIFTDILLILVGQYYHTNFQAVFRNSGFAVSTLLMRIALGTPHYLSALLCVFSGIYLLALAWIMMKFRSIDG